VLAVQKYEQLNLNIQ